MIEISIEINDEGKFITPITHATFNELVDTYGFKIFQMYDLIDRDTSPYPCVGIPFSAEFLETLMDDFNEVKLSR